MSYLYVLNINPLSIMSFENVFSHSVVCLFTLLVVSFAVQKFLSLIRSHFLIFAFIFFALGDRLKKKNIATIDVKECPVYVFF